MSSVVAKSMITATAWVPRGVAARHPKKLDETKKDLAGAKQSEGLKDASSDDEDEKMEGVEIVRSIAFV